MRTAGWWPRITSKQTWSRRETMTTRKILSEAAAALTLAVLGWAVVFLMFLL